MIKLLGCDFLENIPVLLLKNTVIFPNNIMPLVIGKDVSIYAIKNALVYKEYSLVFVAAEADGSSDRDIQILNKGCIVNILKTISMPNGNIKVLFEGVSRASIQKIIEKKNDCLFISANVLETKKKNDPIELEAIWRSFYKVYLVYCKHNKKLPENLVSKDVDSDEIEIIIDTIISHISMKFHNKLILLSEEMLEERIANLIKIIESEIKIIETEERIRMNMQAQIETSQKEYYLNEQLKAIQRELKKDNEEDYVEACKKKAKKVKLSKDAIEKLDSELSKFEQMPSTSAESAVVRNYIEWLLALPWADESKDQISIVEAKNILDENHYGLQKIKEHILEIIAAKKFSKKKTTASVLCLVGPPGVGKTSLGRSIAKSLNREFIKISLGGVKDEGEIRGHRRTYVGSMPGKIIQGMKKAKTVNPVFLLDEIDKITSNSQGDPSAALLEVLDFEQNSEFLDNYLDVQYDLSKVFFIGTANLIDNIPYPLLDRMDMIGLSGYTKDEKLEIAKKFIIPKQCLEHNISNERVSFSDEAIEILINEYTKEAGVRALERAVVRCIRKIIQKILESKDKKKKWNIDKAMVYDLLKVPLIKKENMIQGVDVFGVATGLAWTEVGGEVLHVEAAITRPGKGNLILTGHLGDVMQESAQAALTYVRTKARSFGISQSFIAQSDIHVHVPEGATPKDGPSAGITIATAIISALTKNPVKNDFAMTGEITLQGRVLPVGGVKEKLLAAYSYGYKAAVIPKDNEEFLKEDLKDVNFSDKFKIVYAKNMHEVLQNVFIKEFINKKKVKKNI
jgi:ATP-dependent Lon protease